MTAKRFALFPDEPEQQLRLRRFFLAAATYAMNLAFVLACWWMGYFTTRTVAIYSGFVLAIHVAVYAIIRSGLNKRFADPSLTKAQMAAATLSGLYLMYYADDFRGAFLLLGVAMLVFGMFRFRTRDFTRFGAFMLAGYGGLIILMYVFRPDEVKVKVEVVQLLAEFVAVVEFSFLAGYIGNLRHKLRINNHELEQRNAALEAALQQISEMAIRDELTGAYNRRYVMDRIVEETQRCARGGAVFCIGMIDIDFFKKINDIYGHMAGDIVLQRVAATASGALRTTDIFARFGGEEFVMVLSDAAACGAMISAERVRQKIERLSFPEIDPSLRVTISIGIAEHERATDAALTFRKADDALYRAKENGRNQCALAQAAAPAES
ncbi:MAG TPA: diguanylate cyclase [Noviherbaspirillum sp.]|uniref:GGDEF domain-containing protein n=1 Tax=Noviherbaspirillum sp. TaxID=1926288 RepID=UPI002B45FC5B|nr:diguanylate cyclase [Noviherbaspirillum sp.]HJV87695.1 diguanylate cyclase [Noviherbaspirillum sp.]